MTRRVHLIDAGWVLLGGTIGTLLRAIITLHDGHHSPWALLVVNVAGAGALGMIMGYVHDRSNPVARRTRTLVCTGLLGGFTSYSSFAVDAFGFLRTAELFAALGYVVGTVGLSFVAAAAGIVLARRRGRVRRTP